MQHLHEALELRHIRLEEGWTYLELARRIGGLDPSTLQRFIDGRHKPLATTLFKIQRFLDTRRTPRRRRRRTSAALQDSV